jgi:hypothetical protein
MPCTGKTLPLPQLYINSVERIPPSDVNNSRLRNHDIPHFYGTRQFRRVFRTATPVILDFSTRWMQVVNFELRQAYPWGQVLRYPLNRSKGGPQTIWTLWRREKYHAPTGNRTIIPWLSSPLPFNYRTELHRLPFCYILLL